MSETRYLDYNPAMGAACKMVFEPDGSFTIVNEQVCDPIIEHSKEDYASTDERARWGEGQLVARLPMVVYMDLVAKGTVADQKALKKWLNDSDNRVFRTRPGRV